MLKQSCLEEKQKSLWLKGPLFPLTLSDEESFLKRRNYFSSFLKKELLEQGFIKIPSDEMLEFCQALALFNGQIFNASKIARALTLPGWKVRHYLNILEKTGMIKKLYPWNEHLNKRQVKSFKVFFPDSGILHLLLKIKTIDDLLEYPEKEKLWESFAFFKLFKQLQLEDKKNFFWKTLAGAELSFFLLDNGKRIGFEFQYTDNPKITPAMRIALLDLKLDQLYLVFPGNFTFSLSEKIVAQGLDALSSLTIL